MIPMLQAWDGWIGMILSLPSKNGVTPVFDDECWTSCTYFTCNMNILGSGRNCSVKLMMRWDPELNRSMICITARRQFWDLTVLTCCDTPRTPCTWPPPLFPFSCDAILWSWVTPSDFAEAYDHLQWIINKIRHPSDILALREVSISLIKSLLVAQVSKVI